jgi:hypothetical protein
MNSKLGSVQDRRGLRRLGKLSFVAALVVAAACVPTASREGTATTTPPKVVQPPNVVQPPKVVQGPTTTAPGRPTAPTAGVRVTESLIPAAAPGTAARRIGSAAYTKVDAGDEVGAFRVNCSLSHMNFDDPIVYPGQPRAAHLHAFYGNTAVDANSTAASVASTGNSTCTGGTANRSAYWAPAIIDTATGAPVVSSDPADPYVALNALQVYYKTGYRGVESEQVRNFPAGLRMVAGTATSTSPQPSNVAHFSCDNGVYRDNLGSCAPGQILVMSIVFPQCWDGVNLDSPDHKSHMAYASNGCPASHPVALPEITQNFRYKVPASGTATWRLASDMYSGPAGYSAHADWMNGWDPAVFERVVRNCYSQGLDCRMNLLGDGQALL